MHGSQIASSLLYSAALAATKVVLVVAAPLLVYFYGREPLTGWAVSASLTPLFASLVDLSFSRSVIRLLVDWEHTWPRDDVLRRLGRLRLVLYGLSVPILTLAAAVFWEPLTGGKISVEPYLPALVLFGLAEANSAWITAIARSKGLAARLALVRIAQTSLAFGAALVSPGLVAGIDPFLVFSISYFVFSFGGLFAFRTAPAGASHADGADGTQAIRLGPILGYSLPLTLHDLSWWLRGTAMTVVVANHFDGGTVGAFFLSSLFTAPIYVLLAGADQLMELEYYRQRAAGVPARRAIAPYRSLVVASFVLASTIVVATPQIARIFPDDIAAVLRVTIPFAALGTLYHACYMVWIKSLFHLKQTRPIFAGSVGLSSLGLVAGWFMAERFGVVGVAIASAAVFFCLAIYVLVVSLILDDERTDVMLPLGACLIATILTISTF